MNGISKNVLGFNPICEWVLPIEWLNYNEATLNQFIWQLPWLSSLVPGRADLTRVLKTALVTELQHVKGHKNRQRVVTGFQWSAQCQKAFDRVKDCIVNGLNHGGNPGIPEPWTSYLR